MTEINALLAPLKTLHRLIRDAVVAACEASPPDQMAQVAHDTEADTIYAVDRISETLLIDFFEREIVPLGPVLLIAEGLPGGEIMLPAGRPVSEAVWRIIVDPIDGTRGLMYQKRSAWILTGVAPNRGPGTNLQDIRLAIQTEIPLVKQHLSDTLWAIAGQGAHAERTNRLSGQVMPLTLAPSRANTIAHGFASFARYFSGLKEPISAIDEEVVQAALGPVQPGKAHCFEDQYISSAGQLYELMAGHDRFVADIRPLLEPLLAHQGRAMGICSHPYDLCTELIARELGVIVTDIQGRPLHAPLDVETGVAWVGYANPAIQAQLAPLLRAALHRRALLDH